MPADVPSREPLPYASGGPVEPSPAGQEAVDALRRLEETLAGERAESRMIFNSVPALIWYKDTRNRILRLNLAAAASAGKTVEEIEGHSTEEFYPDQAAAYYLDDLEVIQSGCPKLGIVEPIETSAGERRWIRTDKVPQRDAEGNVIGVIVVAQDITAVKDAEDARLGLERKMQEAQKLESLGVLAGGIAHDFNNLLTVVLGNVSLARLHAPGGPVSPYLDGIERASLRAADLCQQMLAYSGKGHFDMRPLDLNVVIEDSAHLVRLSVSKKALLQFDLGESLPPVLADATQMRQVLMNLVINASESLSEQGGQIVVRTRTTHVVEGRQIPADAGTANQAADLADGEYVLLEVSDTGCGMSGETLTKIFDPFFTTKFTGRGLGLAAVLGIVRGHGGVLQVESTPGNGSSFLLLLPRVSADVGTHGGGVARRGPRGSRRPKTWQGPGTILVIDDEDEVRMVAASMIERMGYEVLAASDGYEGLSLFRENGERIAGVVLDLTMPRLDGRETLRALRQLAPGLPVVLISGFSQEEALARIGDLGPVYFVQKPFIAGTLQEALNSALSGTSVPSDGVATHRL